MERLVLAAFFSLLTLYGCAEDLPDRNLEVEANTPIYPEFETPAFSEGRRLDTIIAVDLDDDGLREYVVTSLGDTLGMPPEGRADVVDIWKLDTATKAWKHVLSDTLLWGSAWRLTELTGDRAPEFVASVAAGGNNPIASSGLSIYTGHEGTIRLLWERPDGDPKIERIGENTPAIVLYTLYWPEFLPHSQAVPYVKELISLQNGTPTPLGNQSKEYFTQRLSELQENYRKRLAEAPVIERAPVNLTVPESNGSPAVEGTGEEEAGVAGIPPETQEDEGREWDGTRESARLYRVLIDLIMTYERAGELGQLRLFWKNERKAFEPRLGLDELDLVEELYADKTGR